MPSPEATESPSETIRTSRTTTDVVTSAKRPSASVTLSLTLYVPSELTGCVSAQVVPTTVEPTVHSYAVIAEAPGVEPQPFRLTFQVPGLIAPVEVK